MTIEVDDVAINWYLPAKLESECSAVPQPDPCDFLCTVAPHPALRATLSPEGRGIRETSPPRKRGQADPYFAGRFIVNGSRSASVWILPPESFARVAACLPSPLSISA